MNAVILQPSYIPWRGYFHQIQKADVFVFYDDVQFDKHGWRNRNRIKGPNGSFWLTIPVSTKGVVSGGVANNDILINWDRPWTRKHWMTISQCYAKAPFFDRYKPLLRDFYDQRPRLLVDFTIDLTKVLAHELGIEGMTRYRRSSELRAQGRQTERLIAILRELGADHYISGPSAKSYLDEHQFEDAGITLEYMVYDYPEYPQLYPPFEPQVSVLDLLFTTGPNAPKYIWDCTDQGPTISAS